jgi:outer membrane protein
VIERLETANPDVARARAALERARAMVPGARAVLDPVVDAQLQLSHARTPTSSGLSSGIATDDRYAVSAGISRVFAPGTRLSFSVIQSVNRSVFPLRVGFGLPDRRIVDGPDVSTQLTLEASQPILRGAGRAIVLLAESVAMQEVIVREREVIRAAEDAALGALVAYVELRQAVEELAVRRRSLQRTELQLEAARAEVDAGQIAPIELDRVRERLAARQEAVLVAEADRARRSRELGRAMGESVFDSVDLVPAQESTSTGGEIAFDQGLCAEAEQLSPDIAGLREQVALARLRRRGTQDARRPNLSAAAGITQSGLDSGWAESVGQAARFEAPTFFGGVVFSTPLRNRAARAEDMAAAADVDTAIREVEEAARVLCFEVREAVEAVELQRQRLEVATERVAIARRALEAEEHRLGAGLSTVQSGLDALELVEEAEVSLARVRTDGELAKLRLERLRGRLLSSDP